MKSMKHTELDTKSSYRPWFSKADAEMQNRANQSLYSARQCLAAERMKQGLDLCYYNTGIYINYRAKFIAVKVNRAQIRRGMKLELAVLEQDYTAKGYTKAVTEQGVIYRIPR